MIDVMMRVSVCLTNSTFIKKIVMAVLESAAIESGMGCRLLLDEASVTCTS